MKSHKKIERFITDIDVATGARRDREILDEVTRAHADFKQRRSQCDNPRLRRIAMKRRLTKVAAIIALAVVLAGVFGLNGGPVAFSQVGHAVSSTLDRLKDMIMAIRTGDTADQAPLAPASPNEAEVPAQNPNVKAVMCAARFFNIPAGEQAAWQSLRAQGIELIRASSAPATYYATLSQEQAGHLESALTVGPMASPRILVGEGNEGMIGTDVFAMAWLPTISSDGREIESSFSFHDGQNGFEIPNVRIEEGGVILVRVKGMVPTGEDILILLTIGYPQAP